VTSGGALADFLLIRADLLLIRAGFLLIRAGFLLIRAGAIGTRCELGAGKTVVHASLRQPPRRLRRPKNSSAVS